MIVHVAGAANKHAIVVCPLCRAEILALLFIVRTIANFPILLIDQRNRATPVVDLICPVRIRLIVCIEVETRSKLKKPAVGHSVLEIITLLDGVDLPSHATITGRRVPARSLVVEDTLSKRRPRRLTVLLWIVQLRGGDGRQTPENLVIITKPATPVVRKIIVVLTLLVEHARSDDIVVLAITSDVPILNQRHEHSTTNPPSGVHLAWNPSLPYLLVVHAD